MLEQEEKIFDQKLPELVKTDLGKFVLVKDDKIICSFAAISDALNYGYEKFRDKPFFVRQVSLTKRILDFTNNYNFC